MKKLLALLTVAAMVTFTSAKMYAQEEGNEPTAEQVEQTAQQSDSSAQEESIVEEEVVEETTVKEVTAVTEEAPENQTFTQIIKEKFIEGGPEFMGLVLITLILGLAIVIERIIYLNLATTNTEKLLNNIEDALQSGGIEMQKKYAEILKALLPAFSIKD